MLEMTPGSRATAPTKLPLTDGSMTGGPNVDGRTEGARGFFPGSPAGTESTTWDASSVAAAAPNVPNKFGGQVLIVKRKYDPLAGQWSLPGGGVELG